MALDVIALLAELVACPSASPQRAPVSERYPGENNLQRLLERLLRTMGAQVELDEVLPGRSNLLAIFPGKNSRRTLLLAAHADTVPQDGMTIPPFTPEIRNGRLYGRGSTDTKGGMAAMLAALSRVVDSGRGFPCNIAFATTCNEECGADGAQALMRRHPHAFDGAVVAEPTDLAVVTMHKGVARFRIETKGIPAHTSMPEKGASAIFAMTPVIQKIEVDYRAELAKHPHPLLDYPRVTVGLIQGGKQVNIVPDSCVIEVDRRTNPGESSEAVRQELEAILEECRRNGDPRIEYRCEPTETYPPLQEPKESRLCRLADEACRKTLGKTTWAVAPYATDAGVFAEAGLPAVVLGPGSIAQAHTQDEYIELSAVRQAVDIYESIIGLAGQNAEGS